MKPALAMKTGSVSLIVFAGCVLFAGPPQLPPNNPQAQYDESKVSEYTRPVPLVMLNGEKVSDTNAWEQFLNFAGRHFGIANHRSGN